MGRQAPAGAARGARLNPASAAPRARRILAESALGLLGLVAAGGAASLDIQGHRGARGLAPENTLAGFQRALSIGVSTLELDVGLTRDGDVVVAHDRRLSAALTRDERGMWLRQPGPPLRDLTLGQLARYDVGRIDPGSRYAARFPDQIPVDGARIPTLAAVIELLRIRGAKDVRLNVETKLDPREPHATAPPKVFADALVAALRAGGMAQRSCVQSFDWRSLRRVQEVAPEICTAYLTVQQEWLDNLELGRTGVSPWTAGLDGDDAASVPDLVRRAGGSSWSPYHRELTEADVRRAHALGIAVVPWTVNEPARMRELVAMGVDGIISDYPDRLRAVAAALDLPLPPAR